MQEFYNLVARHVNVLLCPLSALALYIVLRILCRKRLKPTTKVNFWDYHVFPQSIHGDLPLYPKDMLSGDSEQYDDTEGQRQGKGQQQPQGILF